MKSSDKSNQLQIIMVDNLNASDGIQMTYRTRCKDKQFVDCIFKRINEFSNFSAVRCN